MVGVKFNKSIFSMFFYVLYLSIDLFSILLIH